MSKTTVTVGGYWLIGFLCFFPKWALAQAPPGTPFSLNDLSAFKPTTANWRIVGGVRTQLTKLNVLLTEAGTGVLVNLPTTEAKNTANLQTTLEHGDADLEFDYLMAAGANSGVYLQGRYEVQLLDSWTVRVPKAGDNGSIYERWHDNRDEGYDGHPARQNASRAPGLWQHLKISFQAPRFNASGKKTENARIIRAELNGVLIHEDVELTGPTRGPAFTNEASTGPLLFQGDHGAVAFRNIQLVNYDKPRPQLLNLTYALYKGKDMKEADVGRIAPVAQGAVPGLSASVSKLTNEFLLRYTGTLRVAEPGDYRINISVPGGGGMVKINNVPVVPHSEWNGSGQVTLPKGDLPINLYYVKFADWVKPSLGLTLAGPGIREYALGDDLSGASEEVDPIIVETPANTMLRSFMDVPEAGPDKARRVTHAVSVGSPDGVHYTYDLDNGALVQVWRGQFLDATPMWHDRGDGSARPLGMVVRLGTSSLFVARLASPQTNWIADTVGSGFRPKGYVLDGDDRPTFRYQGFGASVTDKIRVLPGGKGIQRDVTLTHPTSTPADSGLYARIATGTRIRPLDNGLYLIDEQQYVRLDDLGGTKPTVRNASGRQELLMPLKSKITYSILF